MKVKETICFNCLDLFPAYEAINASRVKLVPAKEMCSFCAYLEEHRSPFKSEAAEILKVVHLRSSRVEKLAR